MTKRKAKKKKDKKDDLADRSLDEIVGALLKVPPKSIREKRKRSHTTKRKN